MKKEEWVKKFRFNLEARMRESGLTMKELSVRSGLSISTISRYLNEQTTPKLKAVINLSIALNCDLEDLADIHELIE